MSILDSSYCGSIWHHGIKGQKWGIRRTLEQLGHEVANSKESAKIGDTYHSAKGFTAAVSKLAGYCLNPEKKHFKDFAGVGYTTEDADLLFKHLEDGFDLSKKSADRPGHGGGIQFSIPMLLGVTEKKTFTTSWHLAPEASEPKFTSAYRDRRNKDGD